MKVYENAWVTAVETYLLVKLHRSVAVRIQSEDALMQLASFGIGASFTYNPLEKRYHSAVATKYHTFWMPLHTQH